jgi:serine/threonine protein kinase
VTRENEFKIGDFGMSKKIQKVQMETFVGTRNYMSPAQLKSIEYLKFPTDPCANDIWALGIIFLEVCLGHLINETLFKEQHNNETNSIAINETIDSLRRAPEEIKELLKKMLKINENQRITVQKALKIATKLKFHPNDKV